MLPEPPRRLSQLAANLASVVAQSSWRCALWLGLLGLWGVAGCLADDSYPCASDPQCAETNLGEGRCLVGWCAYPDDACEGRWRFSPSAGGSLASQCVSPEDAIETDSDTTESNASTAEMTTVPSASDSSTQDAAGSSSDSGACAGGCTSPPGPCFAAVGTCLRDSGTCEYAPLGQGTACDDSDACTASSSCDGAGVCSGAATVLCESAPPCFSGTGVCNPADGTCTYTPAEAGVACEDDNGCTLEDACDGAGNCVAGGPCASDNPCVSSECQDGSCVETPLADGTQCGDAASMRCCGGACADISSDVGNCGGCGVACDPGFQCESVSATACESAPAATSGRCRCSGFNAQCPSGQICRTVNPWRDRCTPDEAADCPGQLEVVSLCPDYCSY